MADLIAEPTEDLEEILRDACAHMARSLDLLARVVHPPGPDEIGPLSVHEPIAFVATLHRAGRTHVRIEQAVDPTLPAVAAVARHLEHALLNLILFATDAQRPRESGLIRIHAHREGDRVHITVAWDGPAVPPELEASLFELPPEGSDLEQPLTVGLPVAHEVVLRSGGTLTYSRECGPGPGFVLSLPLWRRRSPGEPDGYP
jgi:C4-dicarboxylate-specific signal transduction histidine kinase